MKLTFLGTGTSQGIPVIACNCDVCLSSNPKDKRLRTAAMLSIADKNFVIDVGPDFRQQMLRANVQDVEAVLLTHQHNDHIIGLDDVRPLNFKHEKNIPIYASQEVLEDVKNRFSYIFSNNPYPGAPRLELHAIEKSQSFNIKGINIIPIEVFHGNLPILAFRVNNFCYITDVKTIAPIELEKLRGLDVLVISALHQRSHHSHLNLSEALTLINIIKPKKAFLIHLSHRMGLHDEVEKLLPKNVFIAYDGLMLEI